jgi:hypothetical protein
LVVISKLPWHPCCCSVSSFEKCDGSTSHTMQGCTKCKVPFAKISCNLLVRIPNAPQCRQGEGRRSPPLNFLSLMTQQAPGMSEC